MLSIRLIFLQSAGSATTTAGWANTPVQPSHSEAGARLATVYSGTSHTASPELVVLSKVLTIKSLAFKPSTLVQATKSPNF